MADGGDDALRMPMMSFDLPIRHSELPRGVGILGRWQWLSEKAANGVTNIVTLVSLAREGLLPGLQKQPSGFVAIWLSFHNWRASSTRETSWMAPFTKQALRTYTEINDAVARGSRTVIRQTCMDPYLATLLSKISNRPKDVTLRWQLHEEASPTKCVSIRRAGIPGVDKLTYVQALVRFDTWQSLHVFGPASPDRRTSPIASSVEKKRVVEYLLFQAKMESPSAPLRVRQQVWADPSRFLRQTAKST